MTSNMEIKGILGAATGVLMYLYNSISELMFILVLFMLFDYITGIVVSFKQGCFHPSEGAWGAVKKTLYGVLVATGFLADYIINFMAHNMGVPFQSAGMIGIAVCLYLTANEGLSVSRNLIILGIPVPEFLLKFFGYIKDESGNIAKIPNQKCKTKRKGC